MSEISLRRFYTAQLTNDWYGRERACWEHGRTFRGTPRQILAEVREFGRVSGGCDIAVRITGPRGEIVDVERLRDAVVIAEMAAEDRRRNR